MRSSPTGAAVVICAPCSPRPSADRPAVSSEEFVFVVNGDLEVDLDGTPYTLSADHGLLIPKDVRHRFRNVGDTEARMVFHLGPLAPRPELGHVDTEDAAGNPLVADGARPSAGRPPEAAGAVS
jgi:putative monooxygenase